MLTVLFCDLVGFTARSDRKDPEDVKATLRPFHARMQREIERFGGTVDQFLGDGILAVFGAPVAHEDDPERAVLAGLRMLEAIEELNRERSGLGLAVRIGIETGEAMVSMGVGPQVGGSVTGDVANTAARLQTVAPPGGIVVGEETYRATAPVFRYEPREPVGVKGKAEPLAIFQPMGPTSRLPEDARRRFRTPLVGRADELDALESLLLRVVRGGAPGAAILTGEAGVGKSRLVNELAGRADALPDLVRWRQCRPFPYGEGSALAAFADVVKAEAGILDSDDAAGTDRKLTEMLARLSENDTERAAVREALAPLVGLGDASAELGGSERIDVRAGVVRFVELLATQDPLVLVVEDVHLAGRGMLDLVDQLLDWSSPLPLLLIVLGRPELRERRPGWFDDPGVLRLDLEPLPDEATMQLIQLLLGSTHLQPAVVRSLVDRSEGVPLYAEEFVQLVRERDIAGRPTGEADVPLPPSLRTLVAARLDDLPADERAVLQDAAVVGRSFWTGALAAMEGLDPGRLDPILAELADRELLRRVRPSSVAGEDEFAFWHQLIRDVAYVQIPRGARSTKHRAVAEWIEGVAGDRVGERAESLALHYGQSYVLALAGGDTEMATAVAGPAASYAVLAAERAVGFDPSRAARLARRALSILPAEAPARARALRVAGVATSALGRFDESEVAFSDALAAYQRLGDQEGRADVMVALSRARLDRGDMGDVATLLEVALGLLESLPPGAALARAYARTAGFLNVVGDYEGCLRRARQTLALADRFDMPRERVLGRNYVGAARVLLGDHDGVEDLRRAVDEGIRAGLGAETAIAMNNHANVLRFTEGSASSLRVWEAMSEFCRERGLETSLTWAWQGLLELLFDTGQWDRLQALGEEAERWERVHGSSIVGATSRSLSAWVSLRRGDVDTAQRRAAEVDDLADRVGTVEFRLPAALLRAELAYVDGREAQAIEAIDGFERIARGDEVFASIFLPVVSRLLIALGQIDRVETLLRETEPPSHVRGMLSFDTARAALLEATGADAEAGALYGELALRWADYGFPLEVALVRIGEARTLRARGRELEAEAPERQARETLITLGIPGEPLVPTIAHRRETG
jgi:class 3 adenylate cyclase/tetratricopeptide (TPR) repeat protein